VPPDDFPIVTRVFSNPLTGSILYSGLARPQALYVIIPNGNSLQLYRGAVMAYREFTRSSDQLLDDESWRGMVQKGDIPPAPPFTRSFYAEKSASEWLKELRAALGGQVAYDAREEIFWGLGSSVTDHDLPDLIQLLKDSKDSDEDFTAGIAGAIAKLNWGRYQNRLVDMLGAPDSTLSETAGGILVEKPEALDASILINEIDSQSTHGRRLRLMLISELPEQTVAASNTLCQAARSPDPGIRWQALMAIGQAHWKGNPPKELLTAALRDTNEIVAAASVRTMVRLGMTNMAAIFLNQLETNLQSGKPAEDAPQGEIEPITKDWEKNFRPVGGMHPGISSLLDPDNWDRQLRSIAGTQTEPREAGPMRFPPNPFMPSHNLDLTTELIAAFANLRYTPAVDELFKLRGTFYDDDATRALAVLSPARLSGVLLTTAFDKQIDGYERERALFALGNLSITNRVKDLIPLLDDTTPINYTHLVPTTPWRVRDRAAVTISIMLGWEDKRMPLSNLLMMNGKGRDAMMARVREWAKQVQ
jgi:HEAT repeat protein